MLGKLERSGIGEPVEFSTHSPEVAGDVEKLSTDRGVINAALRRQLRHDEHGQWLLENAMAEASEGRMSMPCKWESWEEPGCLLQPRFAVQQTRVDGTIKLRSIDHFSWSPEKRGKLESVNGHVSVGEKLKHHTLDNLADAMRALHAATQEPVGLLKADIDSAFRRVPIAPGHRWACGVACELQDEVIFFLGLHVIAYDITFLLRFSIRNIGHVHWERWARW